MIDRKAAAAAYKERKTICGIYLLRCRPSGRAWVGYAGDIEKIRNRLDLTLRMGATPHRSLREDCLAHGADSFLFEVLETHGGDEPDFVREAWRKARLAYWREARDAQAI